MLPGSFADRQRGSRQERGYGAAWEQTRKRILSRDCGLCQCDDCKALTRVRVATEVDHRVPKAQGGTDDDGNLQAINRDCHKLKTAREALAGRGVAKLSAPMQRTDPESLFSRAQVQGWGG